MPAPYLHLDLYERRKIARWHEVKVPTTEIAARLGRHRSTIFRELRRNRFVDREIRDPSGYYALNAQSMAAERRANRRKLVRQPALREAVVDRLQAGWTPEQIAGRLRLEQALQRVTHASITENKRLGEVLAFIQAQQDATPPEVGPVGKQRTRCAPTGKPRRGNKGWVERRQERHAAEAARHAAEGPPERSGQRRSLLPCMAGPGCDGRGLRPPRPCSGAPDRDISKLLPQRHFNLVATAVYVEHAPASEVYVQAMPRGQFTNLKAQARLLGLEERWPKMEQAYADANQMLGDIVKVTRSSKVVGDIALMMVAQGHSRAQVEDPEVKVAFPESVVDMLSGNLGQSPGRTIKRTQRPIGG